MKRRQPFTVLLCVILSCSSCTQKNEETEKQFEASETFYHTACIFENAAKPAEAMLWLVKAETACEADTDHKLMGLIYAAKGRIYQKALDYGKAAENYHLASESSHAAGDLEMYQANILNEAECQIMNHEYDSASTIIEALQKSRNDISFGNRDKFYKTVIRMKEKTAPEDTDSLRTAYLDAITDPELTDWIMIADTYISAGKADEALTALESHKKQNGENAAYHYRMGQAFELNNEITLSLESYRQYGMVSDSIARRILSGSIRLIEENTKKDEPSDERRHQTIIPILAICIGILILLTLLKFIMSIRRKLACERHINARLKKQFDDLMMERQELTRTFIDNDKSMKKINERLRIIDHFVLSEALNDTFFEAKASENLNNIINDRRKFVKDTRLIFNASYPTFINFLKDKGLDETEMEYCCLYAIGLNGKMVTSFTNAKRHYHIGCGIRKKLGLGGHDTNLSIYIRNLLHELEYTGN